MCGRYYVDDETATEIEKLVLQINKKQSRESSAALGRAAARDIYPGQEALVLLEKEDIGLCCGWQHWGFSGFDGKKIIFNARSESAMEKPMFQDSVRRRRIVIPAAGFYEWNARKEKNTFRRKDAPVLFMAGFCRPYEDGDHFVILTTSANASMESVHDRMPLLLERDELTEWMLDNRRTEEFLRKIPGPLERKADFEQLTLF